MLCPWTISLELNDSFLGPVLFLPWRFRKGWYIVQLCRVMQWQINELSRKKNGLSCLLVSHGVAAYLKRGGIQGLLWMILWIQNELCWRPELREVAI